ncbi:hypothetical protein EYF80_027811 [Liparis tanakae]|uniref:Uncharacterized protein n=1 Tax=Liparis tanakae TaxID=230148 RepID=A0A4Z2H873_9TELE|nr:hypothetical protein EYF80_027811 [Liparis tanakae]
MEGLGVLTLGCMTNSESSTAGKRGSSKSRPLCKHCLFRVEYCCPSKAFTEVNILQPWNDQEERGSDHTNASHRTSITWVSG